MAADGAVGAIGSQSVSGLVKTAQQARVTGLIGDKRVTAGTVLASWMLGPAYSFRVDAGALAPEDKRPRGRKG